jgi:hypothetical protein
MLIKITVNDHCNLVAMLCNTTGKMFFAEINDVRHWYDNKELNTITSPYVDSYSDEYNPTDVCLFKDHIEYEVQGTATINLTRKVDAQSADGAEEEAMSQWSWDFSPDVIEEDIIVDDVEPSTNSNPVTSDHITEEEL